MEKNRWIVGSFRHYSMYLDKDYDTFAEALKKALKLNEKLLGGDNGISYVFDAKELKCLQVGNGAFRYGINNEWTDIPVERLEQFNRWNVAQVPQWRHIYVKDAEGKILFELHRNFIDADFAPFIALLTERFHDYTVIEES